MSTFNMRDRAYKVSHFVTVQLIALIGWIIVQSLFSLTSFGRAIPFTVSIVVEAIWWSATLVIMFLMFRQLYNRFVRDVLDLEDANRRLRKTTNEALFDLRNRGNQGEGTISTE